MYQPLVVMARFILMAAVTVLLTAAATYAVQVLFSTRVRVGAGFMLILAVATMVSAALVNWLWSSFCRRSGTSASFLVAAALLMTLAFGTFLIVEPGLDVDGPWLGVAAIVVFLQVAVCTILVVRPKS